MEMGPAMVVTDEQAEQMSVNGHFDLSVEIKSDKVEVKDEDVESGISDNNDESEEKPSDNSHKRLN
jgi:hypothetical protein